MAKRSRQKYNQARLFGGLLGLVVLIVFMTVIRGNLSDAEQVSQLPNEISVQEAYTYRENGAFILDVRTQEEWDAGHIPGVTLIPLNELQDRLDEVPDDLDIVVVCRTGGRSQSGRDILLAAGFPKVTSMDGGVVEWQAAGFPFE